MNSIISTTTIDSVVPISGNNIIASISSSDLKLFNTIENDLIIAIVFVIVIASK